jgi:hypothetical protein
MALAEPGRFASIPDFFRQTWRQDGWRAFFSGYTASALRVVPYRGIDMLTFMTLKELCVPQGAQVSLALMRLVRARTISSHTSFWYIFFLCQTDLDEPIDAFRRGGRGPELPGHRAAAHCAHQTDGAGAWPHIQPRKRGPSVMTQPFGACCVCVQVPSLGRPVLYKGTLDCIVKVLPFMFCCRFLFHLSMSHTHPL